MIRLQLIFVGLIIVIGSAIGVTALIKNRRTTPQAIKNFPLLVQNQKLGKAVKIAQVTMPANGFVTIMKQSGTSYTLLGRSQIVPKGLYNGMIIVLYDTKTVSYKQLKKNDKLVAAVYYDNGNGYYDQNDSATVANGVRIVPIATQFTLN